MQQSKSCRWGHIILSHLVRLWRCEGAFLNDVSYFCLATHVQKQLDSVAPQTGPRLMICDSFNEPGYEQSSRSHYISRNSCCFGAAFHFVLYQLLIEVWQQERTLRHIQNRLNNIVAEAAGFSGWLQHWLQFEKGWITFSCPLLWVLEPSNIEMSEETTSCISVVYIDDFGGFCQCLLCNYNRLIYVWR